MPTKGRTLRRPGSTDRKERDAAYERKRSADPGLAYAKKVRNSARWQKLRKWYKAKHPLCEDCLEHDQVTPAEDVHHKIGIRERPDLAYKIDNLASLCRTHHKMRECKCRGGG